MDIWIDKSILVRAVPVINVFIHLQLTKISKRGCFTTKMKPTAQYSNPKLPHPSRNDMVGFIFLMVHPRLEILLIEDAWRFLRQAIPLIKINFFFFLGGTSWEISDIFSTVHRVIFVQRVPPQVCNCPTFVLLRRFMASLKWPKLIPWFVCSISNAPYQSTFDLEETRKCPALETCEIKWSRHTH